MVRLVGRSPMSLGATCTSYRRKRKKLRCIAPRTLEQRPFWGVDARWSIILSGFSALRLFCGGRLFRLAVWRRARRLAAAQHGPGIDGLMCCHRSVEQVAS